jgi:hypothetical protein
LNTLWLGAVLAVDMGALETVAAAEPEGLELRQDLLLHQVLLLRLL